MGESIQVVRHGLHIGSEKSYWKVDYSGTVRFVGDGSTWEDMPTSLVGKRLSTVAGGATTNYAENSVTFAPSGVMGDLDDMVGANVQHPHKAKLDSEFRLHIHWWQPDATVRQWTVRYRIQKHGQAKTTDWTTVVVNTGGANDAFTYPGSGTINQITRLVDIDMTDAGISAIVQVQLARTDAQAGNIDATFLDLHYEIDSMGSNTEYTKE